MKPEYRRLREPNQRLASLYQVSKVIHSTLDPNQALNLIVTQAVRLMHASSGSVALINPTSGLLEIQASRGLPPRAARLRLRVGEGVTGWVARTGRCARIGDVLQDSRYVAVRAGVRSELAVPLEVHHEIRGVLNVDSGRVNAFSEHDQELLEELAVQAASVIENTWLYEQLRLKARLFESLIKVSQTINSTVGLDGALEAITQQAARLMEARLCSLLLLDETRGWLDLRASHGAAESYLRKPRLRVEDSLLGVVVRRQRPLQVENVQTSTRYQNVEVARREGLVSLLSVPLVYNAESIGALSVYTAVPHRFSNEEIRILTALADLSAVTIEKARLYERIVDAEEQLRRIEKLSALGLLAAEVAHEIRNPLTVMKMLYHSLKLEFPEGDPRAQDARIMGEKMEHLNRIVEQVLDFARRSEPHRQPVKVNAILDELSLLTRHKLRAHHVELVRRLDPDLPRVTGDATQLEQAFLNLILNAVEAMPDGGRLTLTTRTRPDPSGTAGIVWANIEFKDNGRGMAKEYLPKAFPTVLGSAKPGGTGLGLAIVSRIIEAHRGKLDIRSRPGRGTRVRVLLPVAGGL